MSKATFDIYGLYYHAGEFFHYRLAVEARVAFVGKFNCTGFKREESMVAT